MIKDTDKLKRTDKEKEVIGRLEAVLKNFLTVDFGSVGYNAIIDIIAYIYAFYDELKKKSKLKPQDKLQIQDIKGVIKLFSEKKSYLGLNSSGCSHQATVEEKLYVAMVHTIKSVMDTPEQEDLSSLGLDCMQIIIEGKQEKELEKELIEIFGEHYSICSNDEKIVIFFIKRIVEALRHGA